MQRYNIDTCAMLVEFNTSVWTARKLDRKVSDEVISTKNAASKNAARVNKHLLAGRSELDVIVAHVGAVRAYVYDNTLPWSDSGIRLLPTVNFTTFNARMREEEDKYWALCKSFVEVYPSLITAQAMALGAMFKREDFPTADSILHKFAFTVNYMPVPSAGDFRVDVGNAAQEELRRRLDELTQERVDNAMSDVRKRLGEHLKRMSDRLTTDYIAGEAKTRRFHDSLVDGALELCDMCKALNFTGDVGLEQARRGLEQALVGIDATALRKDEPLRQDTKKAVDAILDKFSF